MTVENISRFKLLKGRLFQKSSRANVERIVSNYIRGKYKSDTHAYASDFSKEHTTVDLYELVTGKKLEGKN